MTENYFYPDTHEMFELYDVLETLLSKKNANIGLFEGAEVYADPSLDFLIRILFTPVEDRCSYLSMLGGKVNKEYGHTLEDIKAGTYQGLSEDQFEKKRKEWIEDIRKTEQPMLRILKAIKYGREVETWETKKHFLDLIAKQKGLLTSTEVCSNMIRKGYSLSQIAEIVPWVTKADIYGLSHMIHKPMELTKEDLWEVELEYRKTGEPAVLKKIFGEPDQNREGKSEDE